MTSYALSIELRKMINGARIKSIVWFPYASTISLDKSAIRFLHLLFHKNAIDLIPANYPIMEGSISNEIIRDSTGMIITGVEPRGLDRVMKLKLKSKGEWSESRFSLELNFIPHVQSIRLINEKEGLSVEGISLSRGERIKESSAPKEKELSILELEEDSAERILEDAMRFERIPELPEHTSEWKIRQKLSKEVARRISGIDPILADQLVEEYKSDAKEITQALLKIKRNIASGEFCWCLYDFPKYGEKGRLVLYPMKLPIAQLPEMESGFQEAIDARFRGVVFPWYRERLAITAVKPLRKELKRLERLRENLEKDLKEAERAKEYRHFANLLATYRHTLRKGLRSVKLKDFSSENEVTIPLEPSLNPDGNIKRYFSKAKKGENGLYIIRDRKKRIEKEIERQQSLIDKTLEEQEPAELVRFILSSREERVGWQRRSRKARPRFRAFKLDEKHTAYVGRNDAENDELTHRFASPGDIWFHAQGVPGSHVILKGADSSTPRKILEKAASIAAFFSKAKHSLTVPVIYAEKRYVRKPRKSKPGTAVVQRSKTIFVSPEIPGDGEDKIK